MSTGTWNVPRLAVGTSAGQYISRAGARGGLGTTSGMNEVALRAGMLDEVQRLEHVTAAEARRVREAPVPAVLGLRQVRGPQELGNNGGRAVSTSRTAAALDLDSDARLSSHEEGDDSESSLGAYLSQERDEHHEDLSLDSDEEQSWLAGDRAATAAAHESSASEAADSDSF
ncbi:hypothetical protein FVE85_5824 [Porphyridium purpureum]|uniref:Uncharacterized protein n=1 Tax=Porphyridium purpureum TaxID=35688 RepID=A0A5J4Z2R3_PORPP|nr:hypothetical protein FVE85_5824 [Porphyridium purpureum]|eukprot:POR6834..scf295_1